MKEAAAGADLIALAMDSRLEVLQELANRARVRTMDFETQRGAIVGDVDRLGYLDFGIVTPDGVSTNVKAPTVSNLRDRDYVQKAFTGHGAVSDILVSRVTGETVFMYAVPIWSGDGPDARANGVLTGRRSADDLRTDSQSIGLGSTGYSFMTNLQGVIVSHRDVDLVKNQFNPLQEADNPLYHSLAEMLQEALGEKSGSAVYTYQGRRIVVGYAPVPDRPWIIFVAMERDELMARTHRLIWQASLIAVALVLISMFIAALIGRSISTPVSHLAYALQDISEGEGDLTRRLDLQSRDEIGDLARYFNITFDKIKNLVSLIHARAASLNEIGEQLSVNMTETASTINQIAVSIWNINGEVRGQTASIGTANEEMSRITSGIDRLNEQVEQQTGAVNQSSGEIEELLTSIQGVRDTLTENARNVQTLAEASGIGRGGLQEVAEDIREIARESEGLLEINAVMQNIAGQTNLLSMNAAIEAAHAGEAGKGFAVVAEEIRNLAESSAEQSKTVSAVLKKIKTAIDAITHATEDVLNKFEAIDSGVKTVENQETRIREAMEEQGKKSRHILDEVSRLRDLTGRVRETSGQMRLGSHAVMQESRGLEASSTEISNGMGEISSGVEQINTAVQKISDLSGNNKEDIISLVGEIAHFKIE
jgi:methyl-accepting chemotaxis protein